MAGHIDGICGAPKILAVMPTRACPAACKHCGSFSSPRARGRLDRDVMSNAIRQASRLGFKLVAFTGGEATLEMEILLDGLHLSHSLGMRTRLVTNAHWATSPHAASVMIENLRQAGLDEINYSTGDEHARFVAMDNVVRAVVAALEADYTVQVMIEYRAARSITKATLLEHPDLGGRPDLKRVEIVESPWMPLNPGRLERYGSGDAVDSGNVHARTGCGSILQTYSIEPEGSIGACCGLGMGHIPELYAGHFEHGGNLQAAIESAEGDFLKLWIRFKGPEKILAWAAKRNPSIQWEGMYAHNCQACQRLYRDPEVGRTIQEHYEEVIQDVLECVVFDEVAFRKAMA